MEAVKVISGKIHYLFFVNPKPNPMKKYLLLKAALLILLAGSIVSGSASQVQAQKKYRVSYKSDGFSPIIEGAVMIPSNTYSSAYALHGIMGYQFNPYFYAGVGVSLDVYDSDLFVPVFADLRYFFLDGQFSPYFFLDGGYALPVDVDEQLKGGPMVNPGVGLRYWLTRVVAVNGSLGYRYQSIPRDVVDIDGTVTTQANYIQSFTIRLGLQF